MSKQLVIIAHNIRSAHNIGSLLRTCEGLGVQKVFITGYSPYPKRNDDIRLPHIADKLHKQINKTALGAEELIDWTYVESVEDVIIMLRNNGYTVAGLEQAPNSIPLPSFKAPAQLAILLGEEVDGIKPELITKLDHCLEIPMYGKKESFNVVQAAAMTLYHCRFID